MLARVEIESFLSGTAWSYAERITTQSRVHLLSRGVTALESSRVGDGEKYASARRSLAFSSSPDEGRSLHVVALRGVVGDDLTLLSQIDAELGGSQVIPRASFIPSELEVLDQSWKFSVEIADDLKLHPKTVDALITQTRYRLGVANRASLFVLGLQEGFINPPIENWEGRTLDLTKRQRDLLPYVHLEAWQIAERLHTSTAATHMAISRSYTKTGTRTRSELIMAALADSLIDLNAMPVERTPKQLTASETHLLTKIDRPVLEVAAEEGVVPKTIDSHYWAAANRLGLRNRAALLLYAIRTGHLEVEQDPDLKRAFTDRQQEVAGLLHLTCAEMAEHLGLQPTGVRMRLAGMYRQTGCANRNELMLYAVRAGLLDPASAR